MKSWAAAARGGVFDLGVGGAGAAEADVLARRGGEDHRLLRDEGELAAQIGAAEVAQIDAVEADCARGRIEETHEQLEDRGLAGAGGSDEGDGLAGADVEIEFGERGDLGAGRVVEGDAFEGQFAAHRDRQRAGGFGFGDAVGRFDELDHALRGAGGALQLTPDLGERGDGARDEHGVDHELHQFARGHHAGAHVAGPYPEHADDGGEDEEDHDGGHDRTDPDAAAGDLEGLFGDIAEAEAAGVLVGVGLDGLGGEQGLGGLGAGFRRCGPGFRATGRAACGRG